MKVFLKNYWNGVVCLLGVVGYVALAASYYYKPFLILAPLVVFLIWAVSIGLIYTVAEFFYGLVQYYFLSGRRSMYLVHCKSSILAALSYGLLAASIYSGLIVTF